MLDFPATHRNREAIADVLMRTWDAQEELRFLEVASGSGQHSCFFAKQFPRWIIQPTDLDDQHVESIEAYRDDQGLSNLLTPRCLDVLREDWNVVGLFDAVWSINLIHISPWACTQALFKNARQFLKKDAILLLYGPFRREGEHTSQSNVEFDQSLKSRNPDWGVRCLNEVEELAKGLGYSLERLESMPANNFTAIFRYNGLT